MTSRRLLLQPEAKRTLLEIYDYTRNTWGKDQAEKYLSGLRKALDRLVTFPKLGAITAPGSSVRKTTHEQHSIFYRETPRGIEIGRIYGSGQEFTHDLATYEQEAERERTRNRDREPEKIGPD